MMHFISTLLIEFIVFVSVIQYLLSIMSGDSPNAFIDDSNVFNFTTPQKDDNNGRSSSPTPTTSKDTTGIQEASVSIEPLVQNDKTTPPPPIKEGGGDDVVDDDQPDFSSPLQNNRDTDKHRGETDKTLPLTDPKYDDKNGGGGGDKDLHNKNLINGEVKKDQYGLEKNEDSYDECIVSCLYYTGECCRCSII